MAAAAARGATRNTCSTTIPVSKTSSVALRAEIKNLGPNFYARDSVLGEAEPWLAAAPGNHRASPVPRQRNLPKADAIFGAAQKKTPSLWPGAEKRTF